MLKSAIQEVNRDVEQKMPEVLLWTPSLRFLFPGIQAFSSRKEYLDMLEEYKKDLEEELKEIEKEIKKTKKSL